jgi:tetratricopeptide (TPR) repeat protein
MPAPALLLAFLLTVCFTLATCLQPNSVEWAGHKQSDDMMAVLFGDGRRVFANHFYTKADVYFHSGYYPSIFDQGQRQSLGSAHMKEAHDDHDAHDEHEHEKAMDFLGQPKDWIDRFGRHFYSSTHSHLDKPGEAREILPWLRLSADLDPQRIETYTVAGYWLRTRLGRPREAEQFLREGLRANPRSYEILLELGELYYDNYHEIERARNILELALRFWDEQDAAGKNPDIFSCQQINAYLARLEEDADNWAAAIRYLEREKKVSPSPDEVQKRIEELKQKAALTPSPPPPTQP